MIYKLTDGGVKRYDGAFIPADNSNTDYQEYLKWVADGNTPEPADTEPEKIIYVPVQTVFQRLKSLGKDVTVWNSLSVSQQLEFLTLKEGIAVNDTNVRMLLSAHDIDVNEILK